MFVKSLQEYVKLTFKILAQKLKMAHNISGIITSFRYEGNLPNIVLMGGYHLIPIDSSYETMPSVKPIPAYDELTPKIRELIKEISQGGKCAYIETAYFGGIGVQRSETWENKLKIEGPLISFDGIENKMEYAEVTEVDASINQTLRNLGVHSEEEKDEFDTVGLGKYRSNQKILDVYLAEKRKI